MSRYFIPGDPLAFSGISNIRRVLKGSNKKVKKALESIDVYTTKREAKRPKRYNPYYVWEKRKHIQMDLIDYSSPKLRPIVQANRGMKYLFCAIDGFTKYAWILPMKDKKDKTCVETFNKILEQMVLKPQRVVSDRGSEFTSAKFLKNLESHNIKPVYANFKAGIVERFQRSIQSIITKYQGHTKSKRFIDVLPLLLDTYNNRYHRTIKMSPKNAENDDNRFSVRTNLRAYYDKVKQKPNELNVGDKVKVQKQKSKFARGYDDIFSRQIFNISKVNRTLPIPMYSLTTFDGSDEIIANFYSNELQKVSGTPFEVVKIIKREQLPKKGLTRVFAEIKVNGEKFFAWLNESDLRNDYPLL